MTDLSHLGWVPELDAGLPAGSVAGRVARVDRGRLTVLTADGELRAHPGAALLEDTGPAVGD